MAAPGTSTVWPRIRQPALAKAGTITSILITGESTIALMASDSSLGWHSNQGCDVPAICQQESEDLRLCEQPLRRSCHSETLHGDVE
jgi:hypothetical protein